MDRRPVPAPRLKSLPPNSKLKGQPIAPVLSSPLTETKSHVPTPPLSPGDSRSARDDWWTNCDVSALKIKDSANTKVNKSPPPYNDDWKQSPPPSFEETISQSMRIYNLETSSPKNVKDESEHDDLMNWWDQIDGEWEAMSYDHLLSDNFAVRAFENTLKQLEMALQVYVILLTKHGEPLRNHITELRNHADAIDKVSKKLKIAAITGATGAVGGVAAVAAVAGVVLSPITMGASLAMTAAAVGVGVAAGGAATGASVAIAKKVTTTQDREKLEAILQEYVEDISHIEKCLKFIHTGTERQQIHNLSTLTGTNVEARKAAKVMEVALKGSSAFGAITGSSGVIKGFATGMDLFFSKKDKQKLKKKMKSTFAQKIRTVASELDERLEECFKYKCGIEQGLGYNAKSENTIGTLYH